MRRLLLLVIIMLGMGSIHAQGFFGKLKVDALCSPHGYVFGEKHLNAANINMDVNYQVSKRVSLHTGYSEGFYYYRNDDTKSSRLDGANLGLGYYLTAPQDEICSGAFEIRGKLGYNYIHGTDDIGLLYQVDLRAYTSKYSFAGLGVSLCSYEEFGNKAAIYWLFGIRL